MLSFLVAYSIRFSASTPYSFLGFSGYSLNVLNCLSTRLKSVVLESYDKHIPVDREAQCTL